MRAHRVKDTRQEPTGYRVVHMNQEMYMSRFRCLSALLADEKRKCPLVIERRNKSWYIYNGTPDSIRSPHTELFILQHFLAYRLDWSRLTPSLSTSNSIKGIVYMKIICNKFSLLMKIWKLLYSPTCQVLPALSSPHR